MRRFVAPLPPLTASSLSLPIKKLIIFELKIKKLIWPHLDLKWKIYEIENIFVLYFNYS